MASLAEELISTLDEELAVYRKMIPIARKKTQAIIDNDLTSVETTTMEEQECVERINALEQKRTSVMKDMSVVLGRKEKDLTLPVLIGVLEKQPEERKSLASIHKELKSTLKELSEINGHNQMLIEQSLEMISFNMNILRSTRIVPGNNYTRSAGQWDMTASQTGMFDAKQ